MVTTCKNESMLSVNDFKPEAVIVGAGEFPNHPIPLKWLEGCQRVVCCDGAADRYLETGMPIWRIVGDCDSLSPENSLRYAPIIRRFADQETNDQTKAALYLHGKGYNHIAIIAATGMREDRTLGNISLLIDYMRQGIDARIYTDYGVFIPVSGTPHSGVPQARECQYSALELRSSAPKDYAIPYTTLQTGGKAHSTTLSTTTSQ